MSQTVYYDDILRRVVEFTRLSNVTSQEYEDAINDAYYEYWNLINTNSELYNLKTSYFVTDGVNALYTLAPDDNDFYKLRGIDYDPSNNTTQSSVQRIDIRKFEWTERNKFRTFPFTLAIPGYGPGVQCMTWGADQVLLQPLPSAGLTIVYYYWPVPPTFVSGGSTNGIYGLAVYISWRASQTLLESRKVPCEWLERRIQGFVDTLKTSSDDIDRDEPPRCQDVRRKGVAFYCGV